MERKWIFPSALSLLSIQEKSTPSLESFLNKHLFSYRKEAKKTIFPNEPTTKEIELIILKYVIKSHGVLGFWGFGGGGIEAFSRLPS